VQPSPSSIYRTFPSPQTESLRVNH
jgi:hypothetical protein